MSVVLTVDEGVAWVRLDRPEKHNAFDETMIAALTKAFDGVSGDAAVRVVVLCASGKSFSAGADLDWMRRTAAASQAENLADARRAALMLRALDRLSKPTIALVQGAAYGGGVGLVSACDIALAADTASFALSEVRLGLVPAVISPYVIAAIGARAARRYFLTAERFDAAEALRLGLVHLLVPADGLEARCRSLLATLLDNAPGAMAAAKVLIRTIAGRPIDEAVVEETARAIADLRARDEGREGVTAFLEKRTPKWRKP